MAKMVVLLSKINMKNLISGVVIGFLMMGSLAPMSNLEIRALFVSLDLIDRMPTVLEAVSVAQLNDLIISGFFSDNNFDKNGKESSAPSKKKNSYDTNLDYCLAGGVKKVLGLGKFLSNKTMHGIVNVPVLHVVSVQCYQYLRYRSLTPITIHALALLTRVTLPRSGIDLGPTITCNILDNTLVYNYLAAITINPIMMM